jgi:hypothetical protein
VAGELRDLLDIRALRVRREIADLHVLDHALAKWRHSSLLCGMGVREGASHGPACEPSEKRSEGGQAAVLLAAAEQVAGAYLAGTA